MAIVGMTGFARTEGASGDRRWCWELRSVNGRGLDVKARLPVGFEALEQAVREGASRRFKRGSLQATLSISRDGAGGPAVRLDRAFLVRLLDETDDLVRSGRVAQPQLDGLLHLRGVLVTEEAPETEAEGRQALEGAVLQGLEAALDGLAAARAQEGVALAATLSDLITTIETSTAAARDSAATAPGRISARLAERLTGLAPEVRIDPQRFAQEAALLASKADVQEELQRLTAHAEEARALIRSSEPAGRRLDFLAQELNREANTVCSKASELALTRIGLDLKTAIDQFREQCANAE